MKRQLMMEVYLIFAIDKTQNTLILQSVVI